MVGVGPTIVILMYKTAVHRLVNGDMTSKIAKINKYYADFTNASILIMSEFCR